MGDRLILGKFTLIITTRCNLKCRYCCEYVPQNQPFPDMTSSEEKAILDKVFTVVDRINTLHLSGGGEPFLHKNLAEMIELAFDYEQYFDRLMVFTNSTVPISEKLFDIVKRYKDKIVIQVSHYGINVEREKKILQTLVDSGIHCKVEKYYGENQSFGGWVDFGKWEAHERTPEELRDVFHDCAITRVMEGNWRTREGKVHWCSRSQRGMELGQIPDNPNIYVDLFDNTSIEEKRTKFKKIAASQYLSACDYCSGDQGTGDKIKRINAAEQMGD